MPANTLPRTELSGVQWSAADMTPGLATRVMGAAFGTIATTGATEAPPMIAPCAGTITSIKFVAKDALAQHASNYLTFAVTNKGAAGAGTTALLAATDANTTKTSTGVAIAAYTPLPLTLHGTAANLVVAKGDAIQALATSAATLANTVTLTRIEIEITPS